ncbi:DUF91 domain-containing protein [Candidatus Woesearchaeota archaeon]|nr:DUF91 domain-containing protein [Candidatus Woesearchaeota archaeon]
MKEKDFEDILIKYPELIEENLEFLGRQVTVYGRRIDILFKDVHNRKLIIELKIGPIKDQNIGQILSYEGMLLSHDDPTIRVMLIGNRVPPNIQRSLDHHGIAWKEITYNSLKEFIEKKHDTKFLNLFQESSSNPKNIKNENKNYNARNLTVLTEPYQISNIQRLIQDIWITKAKNNIFKNITLGIKHSSRTYDVFYIEELDAWGSFTVSPRENPTRYWNAFGLGNPNTSKSIICEINFNFKGELRAAGLIAINSNREKYILHSGRLGGNFNSKIFWDRYVGDECIINEKRYAIVSKVESSEMIENIINFVKKVESIKEDKR